MLDVAIALVFMVVGYLLGTIPTGYLVARWRGVDIQQVGSGNIGATNVLRALGVLPAAMVMVLDPVKGALAALLPTVLGAGGWTVALSGLAAVVGNSFNVWLRLRGGKGIATSIGVFLVVDPLTAALCGKPVLAEEWGGCTAPPGEPSQTWRFPCCGEERVQFMASEEELAEHVAMSRARRTSNAPKGLIGAIAKERAKKSDRLTATFFTRGLAALEAAVADDETANSKEE